MQDNTNEPEVKDVDVVTVEPTTDEELVDENENDTQPDTSAGENEEEETQESEGEEEQPTEEEPELPLIEDKEPKPVDGETPRERGLRIANEKLRARLREEQKDELLKKKEAEIFVKSEDDPMSDYDPVEIEKFDKLMASRGYVKKTELQAQSFQQNADTELQSFLDSHPEYLPENDKDGVLWGQFRERYQAINPNPKDPKLIKDVLNMVHMGLHGSSSIDIKKINASKEKLKVASHSGATVRENKVVNRDSQNSGIRLDMLKGFSEEELKDFNQ